MRLRRLLVATALLALSPTSAWASGGVWSPVRVAPSIARGSADLPVLALEADGTAVAAWTEDGAVRAATRAPGKLFGPRRAIAASTTLAVPDEVVANGTHALVLLHTQQGTGATLVASAVAGAAVGVPEQAAATTMPITEASGGLRSDGSALAAYAVAQSPMTISSAARGAAGGWAPAGDVPLPANVTLVQQLHLQLLPDGTAVLLFLGQGPAAGDVPRPYASVRSAAGAWAAPTALDAGVTVACSDLGLAVDAAGTAYAVWSVSDGRVRTSARPLGGAFAAPQTNALNARTPRVAGAQDVAGAAGTGVLLAWIDVSGQPVLRTAEWTPAGVATAASTVLPGAATTLESLALAPSTAASAIITETTGTGAAQRSGADVLERPGNRDAVGASRTCAAAWPSPSARRSSRWARWARSRCGSRATSSWPRAPTTACRASSRCPSRRRSASACSAPTRCARATLVAGGRRLWRYGDGTTEHGIERPARVRAARQLSRHRARQRRGRQHRAAHVRRRRRSHRPRRHGPCDRARAARRASPACRPARA